MLYWLLKKHNDISRGIFSGSGGGRSGVTGEELSMMELTMGEKNFHEGMLDYSHYLKQQ